MRKLTLQQLDAGIDAALANASSLIEEAQLLLKSGFHARAYTLSHIAREELAKVTMFYATGLRMLAEHAVNWDKLHKRLRDHKSKLASDALLLFISTPGATETLSLEAMLGGSHVRNDWKNDSLYITLKEESFRTPSQMITQRKAERTIELALFVFTDTTSFLSSGGKLSERNPESAKKLFNSTFDPDKLEASDAVDLIKGLSKLFEQVVANAPKGQRSSK